tara:strand:- start:63 stop:479 length:417 start_codon:yes stop_codon:yes gene_type:complete
MKLTNIVKDILNEGSITPGSKEYYNPNMSDDEILDLAKELSSYPYSRVKQISEKQRFFKDVANILGLPNEYTLVISYDGNRGYLDPKKVKMKNKKKARLFQMYKDKKLDMKTYGEIQKGLQVKYNQLGRNLINWSSRG